MFKLLETSTTTTIGSSAKVPAATGFTFLTKVQSLGTTKTTDAKVEFQGSLLGYDKDTGIETGAAFQVKGITPERFANVAFGYMINDTSYAKAAVGAGSTFTAAHIVAASKFGVVLIYINAAGTFVTRVPASTQSYTTAALAHTAGDTLQASNIAPSIYAYVGRILIESDGTTWTANTDDMTPGSDLTPAPLLSEASTFEVIDTVIAGDGFHFRNNVLMSPYHYIRAKYVSSTNAAKVTAWAEPII